MRKGQISREQILQKALSLFIKKGYHGTSISELSEVTGFTRGALYHHFKDKDDLYHAALLCFFENEDLPDWLARPYDSLYEKIKAAFLSVESSMIWIQSKVGLQDDNAILHFYTFLYEATRRFPEYQEAMDIYDDKKHQSLALGIVNAQKSGEIRSDLDADLLAIELDALLQQLVYLRFVNPRIKKDPLIIQHIFENFWKRLLPPEISGRVES